MPAEHRFTAEDVAPIVFFANERRAIYMRKAILEQQAELGLAKPKMSEAGLAAWGRGGWTLDRLTDDPILRAYRFCNVFREHDRVTQWIREHIREPFASSPNLWWMIAAGRFINWPDTLGYLIDHTDSACTWPSHPKFRLEYMTSALEQWKRSGNKVETGAYMIRAESDPNKEWYSWTKQRYVAEVVLGHPWRDRDQVVRFLDTEPTLQAAWEWLSSKERGWTGWGPFMVGQVVADLRHTRYLSGAADVGRWAPLGPGSTRGLNRLAGRPLTQSIRQEQGLGEMLQIQELVNSLTEGYVPYIELHDIQNCLCETDKYLRVQSGEGRPRAQYVPGRGY